MLSTLVEFPPRQEPATFTIANLMEKLQAGIRQLVRSQPGDIVDG